LQLQDFSVANFATLEIRLEDKTKLKIYRGSNKKTIRSAFSGPQEAFLNKFDKRIS
jgi:hypothetical protein